MGWYFGGISNLWEYNGGFILKARHWNLHIIFDSQLVGAIVGAHEDGFRLCEYNSIQL